MKWVDRTWRTAVPCRLAPAAQGFCEVGPQPNNVEAGDLAAQLQGGTAQPCATPEAGDTHYLTFETGGTKLVAGVADRDAKLLETRIVYRKPDDKAPTSFANVLKLGRELKIEYEAKGAQFRAVGFGFGGTVHRSARRPHLCLHEDGWEDVDVTAELERELSLPAAIENDCKLAALAEAHFGAGRGAETVFYMTIGTGVGGGIVRRGRIQQFSDIGEAEIGHIVVAPDGPPCCCGSRGCVEAVCSGPGMTQLSEWMSGAPGVSSRRLMEDAFSGDELAMQVVNRAAGYLATAIAAAINLTAADCFVIGGGVGTSEPRYLRMIEAKTRPLIVPYFREKFRMEASTLGEGVVTQGAALLASQLETTW